MVAVLILLLLLLLPLLLILFPNQKISFGAKEYVVQGEEKMEFCVYAFFFGLAYQQGKGVVSGFSTVKFIAKKS